MYVRLISALCHQHTVICIRLEKAPRGLMPAFSVSHGYSIPSTAYAIDVKCSYTLTECPMRFSLALAPPACWPDPFQSGELKERLRE